MLVYFICLIFLFSFDRNYQVILCIHEAKDWEVLYKVIVL